MKQVKQVQVRHLRAQIWFWILIIIVSISLVSCAKGPSDTEVINLVKKERIGSGLLLEMKIEKKGGARKVYGSYLYPVTVKYRYITEGLRYGYVEGGGGDYFGPYYEDYEWNNLEEFLFIKNKFGSWEIENSRLIENKSTTHHRPEAQTMEKFYQEMLKKPK